MTVQGMKGDSAELRKDTEFKSILYTITLCQTVHHRYSTPVIPTLIGGGGTDQQLTQSKGGGGSGEDKGGGG